jgi:hypothetical protein
VGLSREKLTTNEGRDFFILRNERGAATFQRFLMVQFPGLELPKWGTSVDTHRIVKDGEKHEFYVVAPCEFCDDQPAICGGTSLGDIGQAWAELSDDEIFELLEGWLP